MPATRDAVQRYLHRHALQVDILLGTFVAVLGTLALWSPPEFVNYDFREPDALGVGLVVLGGAAVAVRSRWPVPALVVAAVASLLPLQLGYSQTIGGLPALLTLYTVAVRRTSRVSGGALLALMAMVAVVLVTGPLEPTPGDWIGNTFVLVTGWAVGRSVRGRRAYTAGLEERNRALVAARNSETRAARAAERARIAREMQDLVAHSLTAMTVQATAARRVLRTDPDTAERVLDGIESAGREAMEEMRRILGVLSPDGEVAEHAPQPGVADLDRLVEQARADGLDVVLRTVGRPVDVEAGVELTTYRLVQEALANAHRHAGPARVEVALEWRDGALAVAVADDGRGVVRWNGEPSGNGLESVRQRVQAYGGRLRAGPRGGGGFEVTATIPTTGSRP